MQPKTGDSAEMGKILLQVFPVVLATSLSLSVTHSSTCKENSESFCR